ncbi:MAG: hypothetical protein KAS32_31030 [Candidatus Peribacteraceae bacterium]|nr:hypothetical protein [Candidatus Peribacteraceae bacterium]
MTELRKHYLTDEDTGRTAALDDSTDAITTIDYEHHEIHSESHYFVVSYADLANGNVLDFTWQMPNTTKWIHWTWSIDCESEINWFVYEGVTATNPLANTVTPLNSNRNSTNTSGTVMKFEIQADLAAANADTSVGGATTLASGITKAREGGQAQRVHELVLDQNALYGMRAVATGAGFINFDMQWYEHTDKA